MHRDIDPFYSGIDTGADPNARDVGGRTPLHRAAAISQTPEIITALVNAGADLNARDGDGLTPLHLAALFSQTPEVVTALVNAGADPNARDGDGRTPLHRAAPAEITRPSTPARTPTRATGTADTGEIVTALSLNAGADPNARDAMLPSAPCGFRNAAAQRRRHRARHRRSSRLSSTLARTPTRAPGTAEHRSNSSPKIPL